MDRLYETAVDIVTQNQQTLECELLTDSGQTLQCQVLRDIGQTVEGGCGHSDTEPTDSRM